MSSHEFAEWMAFSRLQPFGEGRQDFRFARLMAWLGNINRDPNKGNEFTTEMFMPDFEQALDEYEEQEAIPEHERVWNKIKSRLSGLVKKK